NTPVLHAARKQAGGTHPIVVGDRLDTDISGAAAAGWDSLLVTTGVSGPADLVGARHLPTHVAATLHGLLEPPVDGRAAREGDIDAIADLLSTAGLDADGVSDRLPETLVAERQGRLIGTVALGMFARNAGAGSR